MIPISEAISIIKRETSLLTAETVDLSIVCGRVLAEDILADSDLPPFNRSQMDGYAVKSRDLQSVPAKLKLVGESKAGKGWHHELGQGEAVRIMTGAPVPDGADSVQKVEVTREIGELVEITEPTKPGQFINPKASEIKNREKVFRQGEIINQMMIATLASFGYANVKVAKRPTAAIVTTGSEIVRVDETPQEDEIRDSNTPALRVLAEKYANIETLPIAEDNLESLKLQIANCKTDILVLTGGVSMGVYDFTKTALIELGAEIFIEKVQLKPGKPFVFAKLGNQLIFGLPGNPVSAMVTFSLFVRTAMLEMQGAAQSELRSGFAIIAKEIKGARERDSYLPSGLSTNEQGQLIATPLRFFGSSDFVSFSRCEALMFIPKGSILTAQSVVKIVFIGP